MGRERREPVGLTIAEIEALVRGVGAEHQAERHRRAHLAAWKVYDLARAAISEKRRARRRAAPKSKCKPGCIFEPGHSRAPSECETRRRAERGSR